MKCIMCNKKINPFDEKYEILGCDGDFIHTGCKKSWEDQCTRINNMTDTEFTMWLSGKQR